MADIIINYLNIILSVIKYLNIIMAVYGNNRVIIRVTVMLQNVVHIYIYIYMYIYMCVYLYVYICIKYIYTNYESLKDKSSSPKGVMVTILCLHPSLVLFPRNYCN